MEKKSSGPTMAPCRQLAPGFGLGRGRPYLTRESRGQVNGCAK